MLTGINTFDLRMKILKSILIFGLLLIANTGFSQQIITENGRAYKLHTVEKGEGLYRLSVNNGVSQEEIIAANPDIKTQGLVVGMVVKIPMKEVVTTVHNNSSETSLVNHVVEKGETAYSLSRKFDMSLAEFYSLNPSTQSGVSEGQVVKVKGVSSNNSVSGYRIHVIQPGETLYRIGIKYGVKANDIIALNPVLDINAMSVGSLLRIPDTNIPTEDEYFEYHRVAQGETLFSLGVKYNVSQDVITAANPDINWSSLQVGQVVAIRKQEAKKVVYTEYVVQKKETLYSITRQNGITPEQLEEANPDINVYALQKGQTIRIPQYVDAGNELPATINPLFVGTSVVNGPIEEAFDYEKSGSPVINVALALPFDAENEMYKLRQAEGGSRSYKTYRYIEFFQGVKMAADTLTQMGVNVKLNVFDTSNKMTLATLTQMTSHEYDMIIGPAKSDEMHGMALMAKLNKIPMVLPFAQMDSSINDNPYLFQASMIDTVTTNVVVDQMLSDCEGKNIILLTCTVRSKQDIMRYERIRTQCKARNIEYNTITYDPSKSEDLLNMLSVEKENVFLMPTTSEAQLNSVIVAVASALDQKKEAKVSLYGLGEWLTFQTIEVEVFHKLNTQLYTTFAIDYDSDLVKQVVSKYRREYFAEPVAFTPYFQKTKSMSGYSEYSLWGYDVAMKFISAYKQYGNDFIRRINDVNAGLVQSNFKFYKLTNWGGQVNVGLRKLRFTPDNRIILSDLE